MVHRATVYPVVANRSMPHIKRKHASNSEPIFKHHLEPQVRPAQITNRLVSVQLNLFRNQRSDSHYLSINYITETTFCHLLQHMSKNVVCIHSLSGQVIPKNLKLEFIATKKLRVDANCIFAIWDADKFASWTARSHVKIAVVSRTNSARLMKGWNVSLWHSLAAGMTSYV